MLVIYNSAIGQVGHTSMEVAAEILSFR